MIGFRSIDRVSKKLLKSIPFASEDQLSSQLDKLWAEHKHMKRAGPSTRSQNLINLKELLAESKEELAGQIHREMGKTLPEARGEIDRCIFHTDYYLRDLEKWSNPKKKTDSITKNKFVHTLDSKGVVFKIAPFNFPLWLGLKLAIPNLALGNSVLFRPPETCAGMAHLFAERLKEHQVLGLEMAFSDVTSTEYLIKHPFVKGRVDRTYTRL